MYRLLEDHPRLKGFAGYVFGAGICVLVLIPVVIVSLWIWVSLGYTYASGERAG